MVGELPQKMIAAECARLLPGLGFAEHGVAPGEELRWRSLLSLSCR
jgi:hypothetical protein